VYKIIFILMLLPSLAHAASFDLYVNRGNGFVLESNHGSLPECDAFARAVAGSGVQAGCKAVAEKKPEPIVVEPLRPDEQTHYIYNNRGRIITGPFKDYFTCEAIGMRALGGRVGYCATHPR